MVLQTLFIESEQDKTLIEIVVSSSATRQEQASASGIIIAHPYGPLGGNMKNNVVIALQRYFVSKGYVAICMNFRGCGNSKGRTSWTGMPERQDYQAVIHYALDHNTLDIFPEINSLILCGYSFGAMIAGTMKPPSVPCAYLLISVPLGVLWALATVKASFFKRVPPINPTRLLCIHGDRDQFTRVGTIKQFYPQDSVCVIEEADHFWLDFESYLINAIEHWRLKL